MQTTKTAKLRQLPNGTIQALSSDGRTVYTVSIGERLSCDCPAGQNGRSCYHLRSAVARFPAFYPAPAAWSRPPTVERPCRRCGKPALWAEGADGVTRTSHVCATRRAEISDLYA
jgi:hypothetical protein